MRSRYGSCWPTNTLGKIAIALMAVLCAWVLTHGGWWAYMTVLEAYTPIEAYQDSFGAPGEWVFEEPDGPDDAPRLWTGGEEDPDSFIE